MNAQEQTKHGKGQPVTPSQTLVSTHLSKRSVTSFPQGSTKMRIRYANYAHEGARYANGSWLTTDTGDDPGVIRWRRSLPLIPADPG